MRDGKGLLVRLITNGDLRRTLQLQGHQEWTGITAGQKGTTDPITVTPDIMAAEAVVLMEQNPRQMLELLRLHDLVQAEFISTALERR